MSKFTAGIGLFIIGVLGSVLHGFALATLWGWFVYGKFTMLQISIPEALGLMFLIKLCTSQYIKDGQEKETYENTVFIIVLSLISLIAGWVVHLFV